MLPHVNLSFEKLPSLRVASLRSASERLATHRVKLSDRQGSILLYRDVFFCEIHGGKLLDFVVIKNLTTAIG